MTDGTMSLNEMLNFTPRQDEAFKSMFKHTFTLFGGARGGGKLLDINTPIPTPDGWTRIVDLHGGDSVFGSDGKECVVMWRSEPECDKTYDLYFSDGSVIRAGASHQWVTETKADRVKAFKRTEEYRSRRRATRPSRGKGKRPDLALRNSAQVHTYLDKPVLGVHTTQEIADTLTVQNGREKNHAILTCEPLQQPEADLLIDPYVLGAWLGDGTTSNGDITGIDQEIFDEISKAGFTVSNRKCEKSHGILGISKKLREIGVLGYKHIPDNYLRASVPQRLALLQGLMDTDGTVDARGHCQFSITKLALAEDVYELICSLGIKTTMHQGKAVLNGRYICPTYDMSFYTDLPVFRLKRKLDRQKRDGFNGVHRRRYIVDAIEVAPTLMCCIEVDSPDHTYLAGKAMIPTHNSRFLRWGMVAWLIYQAKMGFPGIIGGLFCSTYTALMDRQISKISAEFPSWLGTLKTTKTIGQAFFLDKKFGGGILALRNLDETAKYKSAEFGIIGVDELTEHPVDTFNILIGSLRWAGLKKPCFVSGSNPDGIGNEWVKNYFIHHIYPPEMQPLSDEFNFIPALPTDNPHLDQSYYIMLNSLPEDLKRAWLLGDWDVFKGLAFKNFSRAKHVIEPIEIPDYWTRIIGIDSGYRAPFCALFGARNPDNGRVVVYKEIYETELTDRQQARRILDLSDDIELKAMRYGDPSMWTRKTQEYVTSTAQVYAQNGVHLHKGNNDRMDGKRKIDRLLLDMEDGRPGLLIFNTCTNFIREMTQLMYDKYHTEDVATQMEDHCLVGDTLIKTSVGDRPISEVAVGDKVLTRQGYKKVLSSWMESPSTDVIKVLFSNGAHLIGTGNHPVWVEGKGWVRLDALRYCDIISVWKTNATQSNLTERPIGDTQRVTVSRTGLISRLLWLVGSKARTICTGIFGSSTTEKYQRATMFTTKTRTPSTTIFQTLSAYLQRNMRTGTKRQAKGLNKCVDKPKRLDLLLSNGTGLTRGTNGTLNMASEYLPTDQAFLQPAKSAEKNTESMTHAQVEQGSVRQIAEQNIEGDQRLMTKTALALLAERYSGLTNTQEECVVPVYVLGLFGEEKQAVYNLEVEGANEFYANGVLVHNSYDACRYMLTSVRDYKKVERPRYSKSPLLSLENI